jgi:hypothetical protein
MVCHCTRLGFGGSTSLHRKRNGRQPIRDRRSIRHLVLESLSGLVYSRLPFRLDHDPPNRAHKVIGGLCKVLEIIGCFALFGFGKSLVEALDGFGDPAAETFVHTGIAQDT